MANERNLSLTEEEIRELIANEFPRLITQNTEIRYELIGVMSETFAKKEDITAILNELRQMREESERQRVEFREEMQVLREESEQRWAEFRQEMEALRADSNRLREESEQRWVEFRQEIKALREESSASRAYTDNAIRRFDHTVQGLGARWGLQSEEAFRNGLAAILTDELGFRVEQYEGYDDSGSVFGHPEQIEMDVIIRNASVIAIEIKSSVSRSDLSLFQRKVAFFEQTENVTVNRKFFISPFVDPNAVGLAARMGIELYTHSLDIII
ncbi:DUF3782 domain-containing protein [Candidatus Poribacteria bacterium]|nr:DUF3782 domain-containing protein [Candidatus Poribacteria bacterium]